MAVDKRLDLRGRRLRNGESQRKNKSQGRYGLYTYKYVDNVGKTKYVSSWRLEPGDPMPKGKRECEALRDMEKRIQVELATSTACSGGNISVVDWCRLYLDTKKAVYKKKTVESHTTAINHLAKSQFGLRMISDITETDARLYLSSLQVKEQKGFNTIRNIRSVLHPAFEQAVHDGRISRNPFGFELEDVVNNDTCEKKPLSKDEEMRFMDYIKMHKHYRKYYDGIYVLLHTGIRIGELSGLTLSDIDLDEKTLSINHQLQRDSKGKLYVYPYEFQTTTSNMGKTEAATRVLPLKDDVVEAFKKIIAKRPIMKKEPEIEGYRGFLFFNKDLRPTVPMDWEHWFNHIVRSYNAIYEKELPNVTPHILRHTYCTNMAIAGTAPKILQYLMGHAKISTTLDVYAKISAETNMDEIRKEVLRVELK